MRIWGGLPTTGPVRRRHLALAVIAPLAHPPAARRSRRPFPPGRAGCRRHRHPRASPPGLPRRALAVPPQRRRAEGRGRCAPAPASTSRSPPAPGRAPRQGGCRTAPPGRLVPGGRHRRRPGRRAGFPARLAPGRCAAAAPPGPGRAC